MNTPFANLFATPFAATPPPAAAPRLAVASPARATPAATLRQLRSRCRVSQLELSMRVGVSRRHLSCVATGRARPSRDRLVALLDAMDAPLAERNDALLAAGYAPAYTRRSPGGADMAPVRDALACLLAAHDPAPALVKNNGRNLLQGQCGLQAMRDLAGLALPASAGGLKRGGVPARKAGRTTGYPPSHPSSHPPIRPPTRPTRQCGIPMKEPPPCAA